MKRLLIVLAVTLSQLALATSPALSANRPHDRTDHTPPQFGGVSRYSVRGREVRLEFFAADDQSVALQMEVTVGTVRTPVLGSGEAYICVAVEEECRVSPARHWENLGGGRYVLTLDAGTLPAGLRYGLAYLYLRDDHGNETEVNLREQLLIFSGAGSGG